MKKLTNTIFGKESKYHHREGEQAEAISSERYHTKYDEHAPVAPIPPVAPVTAVPVIPVVEKQPSLEEKLQRELEIEREYREPVRREYIRTEEPIRRTELREEGPITETRSLPAVIHETVRPVETEEIQPVIHRDIEKTEIHVINAPQYEGTSTRPVMIHERSLPAEVRPEVRLPTAEADERLRFLENVEQSHVQRAPVEHVVVEKPPIIEETIHRKIIEEVQPIVHKETIEPHVIRETLPIYEKIIEPPVIVGVTRQMGAFAISDTHIHHHHHREFISGARECAECSRFHGSSSCGLCESVPFTEGCSTCQSSRGVPLGHSHYSEKGGFVEGGAKSSVSETRFYEGKSGPSY